jgi:hypothetical protein
MPTIPLATAAIFVPFARSKWPPHDWQVKTRLLSRDGRSCDQERRTGRAQCGQEFLARLVLGSLMASDSSRGGRIPGAVRRDCVTLAAMRHCDGNQR